MQGLDWPHLRVISSTGEASAPDDSHWLMAHTRYRAPIIEYCGGGLNRKNKHSVCNKTVAQVHTQV